MDETSGAVILGEYLDPRCDSFRETGFGMDFCLGRQLAV